MDIMYNTYTHSLWKLRSPRNFHFTRCSITIYVYNILWRSNAWTHDKLFIIEHIMRFSIMYKISPNRISCRRLVCRFSAIAYYCYYILFSSSHCYIIRWYQSYKCIIYTIGYDKLCRMTAKFYIHNDDD